MLINELPYYTKAILEALNGQGFEAYIVGGAIRDLLLGLQPDDYDITTNARPEQVIAVCKEQGWSVVDNLGQNFGCVVVLIDRQPTEVTTFRGEHYDLENRSEAHRPADVWYCKTLKEDLSRRDFTINAMAMDLQGTLYDYFGGLEDLQKGIIRTVGVAEERYKEDALRMWRACRFVAQLGFTYVQDEGKLPPFGAENTPYYLPVNYHFPVERCAQLSLERVRAEMNRLLTAPYAGRGLMLLAATGLTDSQCRVKKNGQYALVDVLPELRHLVGLHQNPRFHCYDTWEHTLAALDKSPRELDIRWSLLLHDIGKGLPGVRKPNKEGQPSDHGHEAVSAKLSKGILDRLGYPASFSKPVIWLVAQHMRFAPMLITGTKALFHWVRTEANSGVFNSQKELVEGYTKLVEVFLADMGATHAGNNPKLMAEGKALGEEVVQIAAGNMPISSKDLKLSGQQLIELCPPRERKELLQHLIMRVQNCSLENEEGALYAAAKKHITKIRQQKGNSHEQ